MILPPLVFPAQGIRNNQYTFNDSFVGSFSFQFILSSEQTLVLVKTQSLQIPKKLPLLTK
jgi:hypothetical protein